MLKSNPLLKFSKDSAGNTCLSTSLAFIKQHFTSEAAFMKLGASISKANKANYEYSTMHSEEEFCQGTTAEIFQSMQAGVSLQPYHETRAELERGELASKIKLLSTSRPRRSMRLSDCEGDFEWSQRFTDLPYQESYKKQVSIPCLTIEAYFNFTSSVEAYHIDKYGTFIWALSDLIEAQGIRTRILFVNTSTGSYEAAPKNKKQRIEIEIKKQDQYILPAQLAAYFKANFFRRLGFSIKVISCELQNEKSSAYYGRSVFRNAVEYSNGVLSLTGDAMQGHTKEIEQALVNILKPGVKL